MLSDNITRSFELPSEYKRNSLVIREANTFSFKVPEIAACFNVSIIRGVRKFLFKEIDLAPVESEESFVEYNEEENEGEHDIFEVVVVPNILGAIERIEK